MPKTLGEWLFIFCLGLFIVLGSVNTLFATFGLAGTLMLGMEEGFGTLIIIGCFLFVFLLAAELIDTFLAKPKIILNSVLPNLWMVLVRMVWLSLAALLIYGLLDGILSKYYWIYLCTAVALFLVNLPSIIFHAVLCVPRFRRHLWEFNEDLNRRAQERRADTQRDAS